MAKLRARTAMDHDRRHYKAAKALVIVIPLLGFTYLLTFIGPNKESNPLAYTIFQSVRAVLLSTQGGVITLPYCYLNTEVQGVIRTRWDRWQMVRNVEYASHSTRTSLATSTIYYTQVINTYVEVVLAEGGLVYCRCSFYGEICKTKCSLFRLF